jgi:putative toxin-antitoxin system antitoxin component (TIGR02293 family)
MEITVMEWRETAEVLGGVAVLGEEVNSGVAFARRIEKGLPGKAVIRLKSYSRLSESDLTAVIPRRTLTGLRKVSRLSPEQSDRIARTAGIFAFAERVFGDVEDARAWLLTPNPALKGETPLSLLRTGSGAEVVENVLIRIEDGVYE